jgi:hypothetical protein
MPSFVRIIVATGLALASLLAVARGTAAHAQTAETYSRVERLARAYEESCLTNLRAINTAQAVYREEDPNKSFARHLERLGSKGAAVIEPVLASGRKDGYLFRLIAASTVPTAPITHYVVSARPIKRLAKDQRSYFTDETGVIRFTAENRMATSADPALGSAPRQ